MNCLDNSHDHRGRGCPTSTPRDPFARLSSESRITLGDARRGMSGVGAAVEELPGGLVDLAGRRAPIGRRLPKLLGGFDPLLHGWVDREPVLGGNRTIVTTNGIFRPFALVGGRAVGTWG